MRVDKREGVPKREHVTLAKAAPAAQYAEMRKLDAGSVCGTVRTGSIKYVTLIGEGVVLTQRENMYQRLVIVIQNSAEPQLSLPLAAT